MPGSVDAPDLTVVVVTRDSYRKLRPILASFAHQTIASRIELVVVAPDSGAGTVPSSESAAFHSCRVVPVGPVTSRGRAAAAGVAVARGPFVALTENHCFPDADWAERTLEAHSEGHVAVGPSVLSANPSSPISRVLHAAGYGAFPPDGRAEEREELPLHNTSYRADVLRSFGDDLSELLADERRLQAALRRAGHTLRFHPAARKRHINEATLGLMLGLAWDGGRRYGGVRARQWSLWRRVAYGLASPALAVPIAASLSRKTGRRGFGLDALAGFGWALGHALGEGAAYLGGETREFPFTENDEFMIRERLGRHGVTDPEIAAWLQLQD